MPTEEAQTKVDGRPPVLVKSMREGLLFVLDEQCPLEDLVAHLNDLLFGATQNVFDGPAMKIAVDYGARPINPAEVTALLQVFLQKDNFVLVEWGPQTLARRSLAQHRTRQPGQSIYKGTVRAGQRLMFDGDVVIVGDVNPGGEVVATGDVYVFGKLAGIVHGGATGDSQSVIAAAEFVPMQLRIAAIISRSPEEQGKPLHTFMEFAYVRDDGMAVDKMQYLQSIRQRRRAVHVSNEGDT